MFALVPDEEITLDLLQPCGHMRLLPTAELDKIPRNHLRIWCHKEARYSLPTVELVAWLKEIIGNRRAIEIGSGHGDLCHHLGIPGTDSFCQNLPYVRQRMAAQGQPTIKYDPSIEQADAVMAVHRHQPQVVVGSWISQWISSGPEGEYMQGSILGVREDRIIKMGVTYIMIGNLAVHGKKSILGLDHEEYKLPFLRSRSSSPDLDRVFVWRGWR